jgi:hypothetical protein
MADDITALVKRVKHFAKIAGYTEKTASYHIFNSGKKLNELESGGRMWPESIEAAHAKLDELGVPQS